MYLYAVVCVFIGCGLCVCRLWFVYVYAVVCVYRLWFMCL